MTIAIDARELRTSTGRYVERLIHYLQEIDHEHDYVILIKPKDIDGWKPSNPRFTKAPCPHKEFTFAEQIAFKKQLDELKPDLVHFSMVQQPVFYSGKVVTTMHDLTGIRFRNPTKNPVVFWLKQQVYKWVNKRAAHKSLEIITPTQFVKNDVAEYTGISPDKITVTLESADPFDEPSKSIAAFRDKSFIMYNGRPLPHKNLRRLIQAFAILAPKHPNLYLMIAGKKDASQDAYVALANELGIGSRVILTDWITDGQLKWAMQHTLCYIYPGLSEGFGLPPLEAMINGAPVAASNNTCLPEVLGKAAHYFDPYDVQAMADAIEDVLTDKALRGRLISAGKRQVRTYSWRRMAEQTLQVYEKALGEAS